MRQRLGKQQAGAADIVLDVEKLGRPARDRLAGPDEIDDRVDARLVEPDDRDVVHEQRRTLIAHAGAGGEIDADPPIRRGLAAPQPESVEHALKQRLIAGHPVGDVVRKQYAILAARAVVEERIEFDDRFYARDGNPEPLGEFDLVAARDPAERILRGVQHLHEIVGIAVIAGDRGGDRIIGAHRQSGSSD